MRVPHASVDQRCTNITQWTMYHLLLKATWIYNWQIEGLYLVVDDSSQINHITPFYAKSDYSYFSEMKAV